LELLVIHSTTKTAVTPPSLERRNISLSSATLNNANIEISKYSEVVPKLNSVALVR
jgi:hypothetical protein